MLAVIFLKAQSLEWKVCVVIRHHYKNKQFYTEMTVTMIVFRLTAVGH